MALAGQPTISTMLFTLGLWEGLGLGWFSAWLCTGERCHLGDVLLGAGSCSGGHCSFDGVRHYANEAQVGEELQPSHRWSSG